MDALCPPLTHVQLTGVVAVTTAPDVGGIGGARRGGKGGTVGSGRGRVAVEGTADLDEALGAVGTPDGGQLAGAAV